MLCGCVAPGVSLTFVSAGSKKEGAALAAIRESQPPLEDGTQQPVPLPFNKAEIEAFRYRYVPPTVSLCSPWCGGEALLRVQGGRHPTEGDLCYDSGCTPGGAEARGTCLCVLCSRPVFCGNCTGAAVLDR